MFGISFKPSGGDITGHAPTLEAGGTRPRKIGAKKITNATASPSQVAVLRERITRQRDLVERAKP
jgi:hypothetical protein